MPKIRSLKPATLRLFELGQVSAGAVAVFLGLQPHADDAGRYEHHPKLVKADVFPMNDRVGEGSIEEWMDELVDVGLVCRYQVDGVVYLHFPTWRAMQKLDHPSPSRIPACPREPHGILARIRESSRGFAPRARAQDSSGIDQNQEQEPKPPALRSPSTTSQETFEPPPVTAQQIVGAYIDRYGVPTRRIVGQLAKQLKESLEAGIDLEHILGGLEDWHGRDQHPSTLDSFIDVRRRNGQPRAASRPQRNRQQLIDTHQTLQAWAGEGQHGQARVDPDGRPAQRELPRPGASARDGRAVVRGPGQLPGQRGRSGSRPGDPGA